MIRFFTYLLLGSLAGLHLSTANDARPNVLFIIVDDLNDMPLHPEGKPYVPTPNFDRLAQKGISFTNAHCNDPICAPSRSSMMTGLYPQTTSLYWFEDYRQNYIAKNAVTLTEHLATNNYRVYTTGKIYHGNQGPKGFYTKKGFGGNIGPWPWDGNPTAKRAMLPHPQQLYFFGDDADPDIDYKWEHTFGPLTMIPEYPANTETGTPGHKGWRLSGKPWRYVSDDDRDAMPDEDHAKWAAEVLAEKPTDKPFVLFTGFSRTHTPLYAPKKYFDLFPLNKIEIPKAFQEGDLKDCAPSLANKNLYGFQRYDMLLKHPDRPNLHKEWLQAYMACVAFIDAQVGTVLDALEESPHADNTVVFLTSDHGFHVGGKENLYKQTLWDSGTRIPFIVAGLDGIKAGSTCHHPISLIDIYPTLVDLCGLPKNPHQERCGYPLDGHSIKPFLIGSKTWTGPEVAITALPGKDHSQHREFSGTLYPHFSVRSKNWRYSLTSDGQKELYFYPEDPNDFTNLANDPKHPKTKERLHQQLLALRDGNQWVTYGSTPNQKNYSGFELVAEVRGTTEFQLASQIVGKVATEEIWKTVRLRVGGNRSQLWINNRVVSDLVNESTFEAGRLSTIGGELKNLKIRDLSPPVN